MTAPVFEFRTCRMWINSGYIVTEFRLDGSTTAFYPPTSGDFLDGARLVGFGVDTWRHGVQHELAHALLADALGLPYALPAWNVAHGLDGHPALSEAVAWEEHLAVALQRLANTNVDDPLEVLSRALGEARVGLSKRLAMLTIAALAA